MLAGAEAGSSPEWQPPRDSRLQRIHINSLRGQICSRSFLPAAFASHFSCSRGAQAGQQPAICSCVIGRSSMTRIRMTRARGDLYTHFLSSPFFNSHVQHSTHAFRSRIHAFIIHCRAMPCRGLKLAPCEPLIMKLTLTSRLQLSLDASNHDFDPTRAGQMHNHERWIKLLKCK